MTDTVDLEAQILAERDREAQAIARADALEASLTAPHAHHDRRDEATGRFRESTLAEQHGAVIAALTRSKPHHARVTAALRGREFDPLAGRIETAALHPDTGAGYQTPAPYRKTERESNAEHGDLLVRLRDERDAAGPLSPFAQF